MSNCSLNLGQEAARATLREVRHQGHTYVDLREVGRRTIFFCTLCLTPCYSDTSLFDHLRGNLHSRRYAAAKATLFGPVPWPFSDGVLFFPTSSDQEHQERQLSDGLCAEENSFSNGNNRQASVNGNCTNVPRVSPGDASSTPKTPRNCESSANGKSTDFDYVPRVSSAKSARNGGSTENGKVNEKSTFVPRASPVDIPPTPKASRNYGSSANGKTTNLDSSPRVSPGDSSSGRKSARNGGPAETRKSTKLHNSETRISVNSLPSSIAKVQFAGYGHIAARVSSPGYNAMKIRKIWCAWLGAGNSDPEHDLLSLPKCNFGIINFRYSDDLGRPTDFEDISINSTPKKMKKSDPTDEEEERSESNSNFRRELRKEKLLAAERMCDICGQPMLPGKDVSSLLNCKTWNFACSSRNIHGAFHVFHTSCLIHWILLCESEIWNPRTPSSRGQRGKKVAARASLSSVLCPECQGTGMKIQNDDLEKPSIPLTQMFQYKLKAIESHKAWMKSPEILKHCSTGLSLSNFEESAEEQVLPLKLLHFYQAT